MRPPSLLVALCSVVAVVACGGRDYVYTPQAANITYSGLPGTRTLIPQERPQGSIDLTSFGVTRLHPSDARVPALHVRMVVANDGDNAAWLVDTSLQLVEFAGEGQSAPMYVNGDVADAPRLSIGRRTKRVIDLYYPLPASISDAPQLPHFEVLWQVDTATRTVASRTRFDRLEPRDEQIAYVWPSYGAYWFYDPLYPRRVTFAHQRSIVVRDHRMPSVGRFEGRYRPGAGRIVDRR